MALPINLQAAMNVVQSSRTNLEKITYLNKFVEEFYKTVGILFLARYNTMISDSGTPYDPDLVVLVKNQFSKPHQSTWMQLCKICGESLSLNGDFFAKEFQKTSKAELNPTDSITAKNILIEINKVKSTIPYYPPKKVYMAQIFEIMRELRNFTAHEWTNNPHLNKLIESDIELFLIDKVQLFFSQLPIKFLKVLSLGERMADLCIYDGVVKNIQPRSYSIDGLPLWNATYIDFGTNDDPLKYSTFLIRFDEEKNHMFVYTSGSKEKNKYQAKFDNLPLSGDILKNNIEFNSIFELFSIPVDEKYLNILETASQKYGNISENNGVIHNLNELDPSYIDRPIIEGELFEKISHPRLYITALDGGGGFGKSELTKKVLWDIINQKKSYQTSFEKLNYIIWISAKITSFEKGNIVKKQNSFENLEDLLNCILFVTNYSHLINKPTEEKIKKTYQIFNNLDQNIIVLDNLETVADIEPIWKYLIELGKEVKTDIKIIITSRILNIHGDQRLNVRAMELDESKELTKKEILRLGLQSVYHENKDIEKIALLSGNIPLLIKHFVSLLSHGYNLNQLEKEIPKKAEQALDFICDYQWNGLTLESRKVLMGIAKNGGRLNFAQAILLCNLNDPEFHEAMEKLQERSFLNPNSLKDSILETLPPITIFVRKQFAFYPDIIDELNENMDLIKLKSTIKTDPALESFLYTDEIALSNFLQKADMFIRRFEIPSAYKWYHEATKRFPSNSLAWSALGDFEFKYIDNDEKARTSFDQAIGLDPKNYIIYKNYAYWEADRGVKLQKRQYLRRSIELNEKAKQLTSNDIIKRVIIDHIASAYMKLGYMDRQEAFKAKEAKFRYFDSANKFFKKVLEILGKNLYEYPQNPEEIHHNLLDYNMMINAYNQLGSKNDPLRKYYNNKLLHIMICALKLDRDDYKILNLLNGQYVRDALATYNIIVDTSDPKLIDKIILTEPRVHETIKKYNLD
jgi:tetratricopeptide (TPR) repeat protein